MISVIKENSVSKRISSYHIFKKVKVHYECKAKSSFYAISEQ